MGSAADYHSCRPLRLAQNRSTPIPSPSCRFAFKMRFSIFHNATNSDGCGCIRADFTGDQKINARPAEHFGFCGAANPDVTVVEYFDYNCPYCRKLAPSIHALVKNDHKVAVVFKEWPIFGGISVYAARSALASQWQGKYLTAHDALIGAPRLSQAADVDKALQNAGINLAELKRTLAAYGAQIDAILAHNNAEAHSLGMRGTPGLLVGRDVSTSIGDLAALQIAVAEARRTP